MKRKILLFLFVLLLVLPGAASARRPSFGRPDAKPEIQEEKELSEEERREQLLEEARQDTLDKLRRAYRPKQKDYDNNTVCSFGPQFREVSPRLTDLWYMFTPVDLSRDGTQTFDLIAGNMFVIGEVAVKVQNGKFQVDYHYNGPRIEIGREYFQIFSDYESIRAQNLDDFHAQKRFSYGRAYSIADKLEGDTDVILFVCNTVTFKKTTPGIFGYYSTNPDRVAQREAMLEMIGRQEKASYDAK